jgi:hypothetical protein
MSTDGKLASFGAKLLARQVLRNRATQNPVPLPKIKYLPSSSRPEEVLQALRERRVRLVLGNDPNVSVRIKRSDAGCDYLVLVKLFCESKKRFFYYFKSLTWRELTTILSNHCGSASAQFLGALKRDHTCEYHDEQKALRRIAWCE